MKTLAHFAPSLLTLALMSAGLLASPGVRAQAAPAAQQTQQFNIPAGPLAPALRRLASTAHVLFTFSEEQLAGKHTAGLQGSYRFEEALTTLLAGTGLQLVALEGGGYTLRATPTVGSGRAAAGGAESATLPTVQVTAQMPTGDAQDLYRARKAEVGILGQQSLQDTPYSINVITRELMDNLQASSMTEALKTDASVTAATNNVGGLASQIAVRGVTLDLLNGRKIDGLNVFQWSGDLSLEHFEQIQVLKGASGLLYGFAQPGGIVNFITKRPTDEPLRTVTATTDGSAALLHADLGGRFGEEQRFGYRANLVQENGETYVKGSRIARSSGSLALDWRITPDLVWSADAMASRRKTNGAAGWGLMPNRTGDNTDYATAPLPAPIRGDRRIFSPFTSYETEARVYGTDLAWRINPDWSARLAYKQTRMDRTFRNGAIYANAAGHYTEELYSGTDRFETRDLQATLNGRLQTGALRHDLSFGLASGKLRGYTSSVSGYAVLGSGELSNPPQFADPHLPLGPADQLSTDVTHRSVFMADQVKLNEQWSVLLGLRHSRLQDLRNPYDKSATTPSLALMFKPAENISTYASYIESLEQGATAPVTAANAHQVFPPLKSKQLELGVKAEGPRWAAHAALFQLERGLTYTDHQNVFTQSGRARYSGLELAGKLRPHPQWTLNTSMLWLDTRNTRTEPSINGLRVAGAPRAQWTAYAEYRLPQGGWTLLGGMRHTSSQPVDPGNSVTLPSVTLFEVGARYATQLGQTPTTFRVNIDNLANKAYWLTSAATLMQGAPRTLKLSAQFDF